MLNTLEINELKRVLYDHVPDVIIKLINSYFDDCPLQYINELYIPDEHVLRVDTDLYNCYEVDNKRIYTKLFCMSPYGTLEICSSGTRLECHIDEFIISLKYDVILKNARYNKNNAMIYNKFGMTIIHIENKLLQHYFPKKLRDIKIATIRLHEHKLYFLSKCNNSVHKLFRFNLQTRKLYYVTKFGYIPACYIVTSDTYIYILNTISQKTILGINKRNLQTHVITHHINNILCVTDSHVFGKYENSNMLFAESINQTIEPQQICEYYKNGGCNSNICIIINDITSMIYIYKIK
jgi:hypothetical protein